MNWFKLVVAALSLSVWYWTQRPEQIGLTTTWVFLVLAISSFIAWPTERWAGSDKFGEWTNLSVVLKFFFSLNGLISTLLFYVGLGVAISWYFRGAL